VCAGDDNDREVDAVKSNTAFDSGMVGVLGRALMLIKCVPGISSSSPSASPSEALSLLPLVLLLLDDLEDVAH
jgi:hypothetical protein